MNPCKRATKDLIRAAEDLQIEKVDVMEWGLSVDVRGLTGVERDEWEKSRVDQKAKVKRGQSQPLKLSNWRASLVVRTVCDEKGQLLFGDKDIVAVGKKSAMAIERVFTVAMRLSGLTDDDLEELAEDLDEEDSAGSSTS